MPLPLPALYSATGGSPVLLLTGGGGKGRPQARPTSATPPPGGCRGVDSGPCEVELGPGVGLGLRNQRPRGRLGTRGSEDLILGCAALPLRTPFLSTDGEGDLQKIKCVVLFFFIVDSFFCIHE